MVILIRPSVTERKSDIPIDRISALLRRRSNKQDSALGIMGSLKRDIAILKSSEGYLYAGYPNFMALFGRDSLISSWQLLDYDPSIAKSSLAALARLQGKKVDYDTAEEPGKILHEYWPESSRDLYSTYKTHVEWLKVGKPVYYSVDSTPLFLTVLDKYVKKTHDIQFLNEIWPSAVNAIRWILKYGMREDGFLKYDTRTSDKGLPSQSWKDGAGNILEQLSSPVAIVEVQGYLYLSLLSAGRLARLTGDSELEGHMNSMASRLKARFNNTFWNEDTKFYALAVDGAGKQLTPITSNPGQLLFTGILEKEKADAVVKRLFQKDMWTKYGIRTHSMYDPAFKPRAYQRGAIWPHDNWIIAEGMGVMGYTEEAKRVRNAIALLFEESGERREYYGVWKNGRLIPKRLMSPKACVPQAWATGAMVDILMHTRESDKIDYHPRESASA